MRTFILPKNGRRVAFCHGRWGHRRVRTTECEAVFKAESLYTELISVGKRNVKPGVQGSVLFAYGDETISIKWEVRPNSVWRFGRPFFVCPRCAKRCSRVYVPSEGFEAACRQCWGLTYPSRSLTTYRDSLWGRGPLARIFGETQRERALQATIEARAIRRSQSLERWALRAHRLAARDSRA